MMAVPPLLPVTLRRTPADSNTPLLGIERVTGMVLAKKKVPMIKKPSLKAGFAATFARGWLLGGGGVEIQALHRDWLYGQFTLSKVGTLILVHRGIHV